MKWFYIIIILMICTSCEEDRIAISGTGNISGTVVSNSDNTPLENVRISTSPVSSIVFTDENGDFNLTNISVGTYSVQAQKENFIAKFESATVNSDVTATVVFELLSNDSNNNSPETPMLLSPATDATGISLSVNLDWEVTDADADDLTFGLKVYNNVNADVIEVNNLTESEYMLTDLMYNVKYFWQVSANDGINDSVLSEVYNFTTLEFPNNRIFYTKKINGNNVIYSVDNQGVEFKLTSENENSWRPRKASGVNRVAFLKTVASQTHLFTMDLDGSNQTQVTNSVPVNGFNLDELDFEWKSNNTKLMFPSFDKLYQINLAGDGLSQLYQTTNGNFVTEVDWCEQTQQIAVKTNNNLGYSVEIFTLNASGGLVQTILSNVNGAAGGLDFNFQGDKLVYTYDDSQTENVEYRQLNTNVYMYDLSGNTSALISSFKPSGTLDLDPKFSPNEAQVIITNTSNDGVSAKNIYTINLGTLETRTLIVENAFMPDWK